MAALLNDPSVQRQLDQQGYAIVRLLDDERIHHLRTLYERFAQAAKTPDLYESSRYNDPEINQVINTRIRDIVSDAGKEIFGSAKIYGGSFMVKSAGSSTVLPLHQDWSVVDEDKYQTVFLWCALDVITSQDGGLFVLPESHRFFNTLRSGCYPSNRFYLKATQRRHVRNIELQAGEAVLYFDTLFHGSYANTGNGDRVVATARLMERDANLLYFHRANPTQVDVFDVDEQFYLTHIGDLANGNIPPELPRLDRRDYTHEPVTETALQDRVAQHYVRNDHDHANVQLFSDSELQRRFDSDGYAVIDFIDSNQVLELRQFYAGVQHAEPPASGFEVSLDRDSAEHVQTIAQKIVGVVSSSAQKHFQDYQIFTASFVAKHPNPAGVVPPHQDWSFVDESQYWSATVWCPLIDVDAENGGLGLIKGSHRFYDHVRPSPSPQYYPPFSHQLRSLFPYLRIPKLEAGQAIVFNNQTIHGSPPNMLDKIRVAFGIGITHRDAELQHYYLLPKQTRPLIEGFGVGADFFHSYNNARLTKMHDDGDKPAGFPSLGVFALQQPHIETERLIEKIVAAGGEPDISLMERVGPVLDTMANKLLAEQSEAADETEELPWWKIYTPINIGREIRYRLGKR